MYSSLNFTYYSLHTSFCVHESTFRKISSCFCLVRLFNFLHILHVMSFEVVLLKLLKTYMFAQIDLGVKRFKQSIEAMHSTVAFVRHACICCLHRHLTSSKCMCRFWYFYEPERYNERTLIVSQCGKVIKMSTD